MRLFKQRYTDIWNRCTEASILIVFNFKISRSTRAKLLPYLGSLLDNRSRRGTIFIAPSALLNTIQNPNEAIN